LNNVINFKWLIAVTAMLLIACESLQPLLIKDENGQASFRMDSSNRAMWWKPIAVDEDNTYIIFNTPGKQSSKCLESSNHKVAVSKKTISGKWKTGYLKGKRGIYWTACDDIGHNQPTMAIDGDGVIHAWVDQHNDKSGWHYFRSQKPGDVESVSLRSDLPSGGRYTYPIAATAPNGDIYLIVRNLAYITDDKDNYKGYGELYHWDNHSKTWHKKTDFAAQRGRLESKGSYSSNAIVYPDDLVVDDDGNVHILWEWSLYTTSGLRYHGSYLKYHVEDDLFTTANGNLVTVPVNINTANLSFSTQTSINSLEERPFLAIQGSKLALYGEDNQPSIVFRGQGNVDGNFNLYRTYWNDNEWSDREVLFVGGRDSTTASISHTYNDVHFRVYFAIQDGGIKLLEKDIGGDEWLQYSVSNFSGSDIRVSVAQRNKLNDLLYISLSSEQEAGELYVLEVDANKLNLDKQH